MGCTVLDPQTLGYHLVARDAIPAQYFANVQAIHRTKAVHSKDGRGGALIFYVRETAQSDNELIVTAVLGDLLAGALDISIGESQLFPDSL
jgi:hypothetical protein